MTRWDKSKPTIEGRKLLVQMIVGGSTQYLAQVQQMPKSIEKHLQKTIHTFIWGDKKSPVNESILLAPKELGGQGLLDLQARNEAIQLIWLKGYLNFGPSRALWTYYADALIKLNTPKKEQNVRPEIRKNIFLQTWKTYTGNHSNNKNPTEIKYLIETAKKYGVRMEVLATTKEVMRQLPMWHHSQADPRIQQLTASHRTKCFLNKHRVLTIGETETLANYRLMDGHLDSWYCRCNVCINV